MNNEPLNEPWTVIDTPMRPSRYKVIQASNPHRNNSWTEYFSRYHDAIAEAQERNGTRYPTAECWEKIFTTVDKNESSEPDRKTPSYKSL